jgi:hypothetical protein
MSADGLTLAIFPGSIGITEIPRTNGTAAARPRPRDSSIVHEPTTAWDLLIADRGGRRVHGGKKRNIRSSESDHYFLVSPTASVSAADLVGLAAKRKIRWAPRKKNPHFVDRNAPRPHGPRPSWVRSARHLACKLGVLIFSLSLLSAAVVTRE